MPVTRKWKVVSGGLTMAVALGAGAAVASEGGSSEEVPELDDVVTFQDVKPPSTTVAAGITTFATQDEENSLASPFDGGDDSPPAPDASPDAGPDGDDSSAPASTLNDESVESPDNPVTVADDSPQSTDSPDVAQSVASAESPDDSPDNAGSPVSPDSVDSPDGDGSPAR